MAERDIVQQLRDDRNRGHGHDGGCQGCFASLMEDAADEICRLRAGLMGIFNQRAGDLSGDDAEHMRWTAGHVLFPDESHKRCCGTDEPQYNCPETVAAPAEADRPASK